MKRRPFLKILGAAAGSTAVGINASLASDSSGKKVNGMPYRILGKTGLQISSICFPGLALVHDTQEDCNRTLHEAIEAGVNYFDNAPAYGNGKCVKRMGIGMQDIPRDRYYLACKTKRRDKEGARQELEQCLKDLKTDYFDVYQLHHLRTEEDVEQAFGPGGCMETFFQAKKEGKIRYIGFSSHTTKSALAALRQYPFDTIMFPINFVEYYTFDFGKEVMELANERGTGILGMKAMCGGLWPEGMERTRRWWYRPLEDEKDIQLAVRFTLSHEGVTAAVPPGFLDLIPKAIQAAKQFSPVNESEKQTLAAMAKDRLSVFERQQITHAGSLPHIEADDYYKYMPCAYA